MLVNTKYCKEFKERIIARMLPPHNVRVPDLVQETDKTAKHTPVTNPGQRLSRSDPFMRPSARFTIVPRITDHRQHVLPPGKGRRRKRTACLMKKNGDRWIPNATFRSTRKSHQAPLGKARGATWHAWPEHGSCAQYRSPVAASLGSFHPEFPDGN